MIQNKIWNLISQVIIFKKTNYVYWSCEKQGIIPPNLFENNYNISATPLYLSTWLGEYYDTSSHVVIDQNVAFPIPMVMIQSKFSSTRLLISKIGIFFTFSITTDYNKIYY